MNKKILQQIIPPQTPDRFSKLLCSTADNKQHVEPWKRLTSWGHTKVLCVCC